MIVERYVCDQCGKDLGELGDSPQSGFIFAQFYYGKANSRVLGADSAKHFCDEDCFQKMIDWSLNKFGEFRVAGKRRG